MSAHARLSASSAKRWLKCPPSVRVKGDGGASIHAATGTFAHGIAAKCLEDPSVTASDFLLKRGKVDGFDIECDLEMVDAVNLYCEDVATDFQEGDQAWIEMPLLQALSRIDPDLGGTADYVRYRPATRHLLVADFKYGSGVYVEVEDNEQLKLYALGAMLECGKVVTDVTVRIAQPRFEGAKPIRDFHFKAHELLDFVADVKAAANLSRDDSAPYKAGDHCTFCPQARTCPELLKLHHALVAADFDVIETAVATPGATAVVDHAKLAAALVSIPAVKERIKAIEAYAYAEASRGVEIPGFKLVDKRANRKWKSEGEVILWAQAQAIDPYAPRAVLSPAQLEKKLSADVPRGKKKEAGKVLEPFVEKVSSGTALVPIDDARPPAKLVTADDFAVIDGTADKT